MRKHLEQDFTRIYHIDLKGNARTSGERRRKEAGNVFDDQIRVGVGISFFVKKSDTQSGEAEVSIFAVDDYLKARQKQRILVQAGDYSNTPMRKADIDVNHTWLTEGLQAEYDVFVPLGSREAKAAQGEASDVVFKVHSLGVSTNRDAWAHSYSQTALAENMTRMIENYNGQVFKWRSQTDKSADVDDFVVYDDMNIKWSSTLKSKLKGGQLTDFAEARIRRSLYRPFSQSNLYFDRVMNDRVLVFPSIFPTPETENENRVICLSAIGNKKPFHCLMTNQIPDLHLTGDSQCFPYYTYDEDGTNRRENITDWALDRFRAHYRDDAITKWDIFHYVYGLLHHPAYRDRYQANLKRELPRIPFAPDFRAFAAAGARLAHNHVHYEDQPQYPLAQIETPGAPLDWRVEKMRLSKDRTQLTYNRFLTLDGIPPAAFNYRLGNRSALEWVIDQYRVKTDKRSGITNDPNRPDDPQYILRLLAKVISVSLETIKIVEGLPELRIEEAEPVVDASGVS